MTRRSGRPVYAFVTSLVAVGLVVGACNDSATDPGSTADGMALVTVLLTDDPGEVTEAWVQAEQIYLQGRGDLDDGNGGMAGGTGDMNQRGRTVLWEDDAGLWVNLVTLADGEVLTLAADVEVPEGLYRQLRFVLGGAVVVTDEGNVFATSDDALTSLNSELMTSLTSDGVLHCPSCNRSGFKVQFPGDDALEISGTGTTLTLDFTISESFSFGHIAGQSGRWIMHPVILGSEGTGVFTP